MTDVSVTSEILVVGLWMLLGAIIGSAIHAVVDEIRQRRTIRRLLRERDGA